MMSPFVASDRTCWTRFFMSYLANACTITRCVSGGKRFFAMRHCPDGSVSKPLEIPGVRLRERRWVAGGLNGRGHTSQAVLGSGGAGLRPAGPAIQAGRRLADVDVAADGSDRP